MMTASGNSLFGAERGHPQTVCMNKTLQVCSRAVHSDTAKSCGRACCRAFSAVPVAVWGNVLRPIITSRPVKYVAAVGTAFVAWCLMEWIANGRQR